MIYYSIIIPHKNTPILLERCLQSIPDRDDIEIIVVDDNSNVEVSNSTVPSLSRRNLTFINNKVSKGAGYSRNVAVQKAVGKWLVFSDADDFFSPSLGIVLDKYKGRDDLDMIFLNAKSVNDNGTLGTLSLNRYIDNYYAKKMHAEQVLRYGFWSPWSRIVRRQLTIDNYIQFEEIPIGNDMMFIINASKYAKKIAVESAVVYYYYQPLAGSVTKSYWTDETRLLRVESTLKLNRFYAEINYPFRFPVWRIAKGLRGEKLEKLYASYNYSQVFDLVYTIKYFIAKLFHVL